MNKRIISITLTIATLFIVISVAIAGITSVISFNKDKDIIKSNWREIPIQESIYNANASAAKFDLKRTITDADYVFNGTIVSRKEYKIDWTDANNEYWGPFYSVVLEVKINKEYDGESPINGDIIKVYYPHSLSIVFGGSFLIKDNSEYVFITRALNKSFKERREKESPDDKFGQEDYADVYISNSCYNLLPVENGLVYMHRDYFYWNKEIMKRTKAYTSAKTDKLSSPELLETGWFIAMTNVDFDDAFLSLFENSKALPSVMNSSESSASVGCEENEYDEEN